MSYRLLALSVVVGAAASAYGCRTTDNTSSGGDVKAAGGNEAQIQQYCDGVAQQYAAQFTLQIRRQKAYNESYAQCLAQNGVNPGGGGGGGDGTNELKLVKMRTQKAADSAAAHLQNMPPEVKAAAMCIAVVAKDDIGW